MANPLILKKLQIPQFEGNDDAEAFAEDHGISLEDLEDEMYRRDMIDKETYKIILLDRGESKSSLKTKPKATKRVVRIKLPKKGDDDDTVSEASQDVEKKSDGKDDKHRGYCFTDFGDQDGELDIEFYNTLFEKQKIDYMIVGYETCPETKRDHYQGFVYFTNRRKWSSVRKLFEPSHIEPMEKTPVAAANYCKKGEQSKEEWKKLGSKGPNWGLNAEVTEWGEVPAGQGSRSDIRELTDAIRNREITTPQDLYDKFPEVYLGSRGKRAEQAIEMFAPPRDFKPDVVCLWGEGGSGKTNQAKLMYPGIRLIKISDTQKNEPFVSFNVINAQFVCIDDFNPDQVSPAWWLNFTDRHECEIQVKNGWHNFASRAIVFTSNTHPKTWWGGWTTQVKRRFTLIRQVICKNPAADMEPVEDIIELDNPTGQGVAVITRLESTPAVSTALIAPKRTISVKSNKSEVSWHSATGVARMQANEEAAESVKKTEDLLFKTQLSQPLPGEFE